MSTVITLFQGTDPFSTATFNNRISQINTGFSYISNPNLLDNWYFGNPVNQRGVTTSTVNQYGIDRWIAYGGTYTVANGYVEISQNGVMSQLLENYSELNGTEMTASVLTADGTLYTGTAVIDLSSSTIFQSVSGFMSYLTSAGIFQFYSPTGSLKPAAAKLELGSQQTLAHQENGVWVLNEIPDYGEQLARCQRYYFKTASAQYSAYMMRKVDNDYLMDSCLFPVEMRATPSVQLLSYRVPSTGAVITAGGDAAQITPNGFCIVHDVGKFTDSDVFQVAFSATADL